ncbi:contractile injection system tape measure protein [Flavobacterium sp. T12S277]|uniref:contractile injection system tape measure protein n=1 Tax=Flavobacterium sp. T12S277 TaxID=3402752 RepID=UPI003AE8617D
MTKNTHSIQRVFLEIDTPSMVTADAIKNNLAVFLQNELFPLLEKQFNLIEDTEDQIIQIEKLQISIQSDTDKKNTFLSDTETKNDIKNRVEKEVQKALKEFKNTAKKEPQKDSEWTTISAHDKQIKTLLYFIENGSMPWWVTQKEEEVFFEKKDFSTFQKAVFSVPFRQLIRQKQVQKRLINQFSNADIVLLGAAFLSAEVHPKTLSQNRFFKILDSQSHPFKASFWQLIFEIWNAQKYSGLTSYYLENQALFVSQKLSFELFIQSIKTLFSTDFKEEELIQKYTDSLIAEKEKAIAKGTVSKNDKKTSIAEEKQTDSDTTIKENTATPAIAIPLQKEKEPAVAPEIIPESSIEMGTIKDKSISKTNTDKELAVGKIKPEEKEISEENKISNSEKTTSEAAIEIHSAITPSLAKNEEKSDDKNNWENDRKNDDKKSGKKEPDETEAPNPDENISEPVVEIDSINDQFVNKNEEEEAIQIKTDATAAIYAREDVPAVPSEITPVKGSSIPSDREEEEEDLLDENTDFKSCYVQNAGIIILHPFLKEMLKNCDLMDDDHKLLNKELAAHILHYAATKKEKDYEHAMLFEKFLCGIPLWQSIPREVQISDKHKQQVEEMLDSAVQHWSALKNTSTAVLRTEFLQREGKLDWSESNPKLTIERKTQDLLLEKIPWNISIVKIPWIEKLIYTQW